MQCKSNLRELGVAIQIYHDGARKLPEAWSVATDKASGYGWIVALLPYMEEQAVSKSINFQLPISAFENNTARNTDLPMMRCPSDLSEPMFELIAEHHNPAIKPSAMTQALKNIGNPLPLRLPTTNYLGVYGTLEADETFPAPPGDGPIVADRAVRYRRPGARAEPHADRRRAADVDGPVDVVRGELSRRRRRLPPGRLGDHVAQLHTRATSANLAAGIRAGRISPGPTAMLSAHQRHRSARIPAPGKTPK